MQSVVIKNRSNKNRISLSSGEDYSNIVIEPSSSVQVSVDRLKCDDTLRDNLAVMMNNRRLRVNFKGVSLSESDLSRVDSLTQEAAPLIESLDRTIYVESSGCDTLGDGLTPDTAYRTIYKALQTVLRNINATVTILVGTQTTGQEFAWTHACQELLNTFKIMTNGKLEIQSEMKSLVSGLSLSASSNPFVYTGLTCTANQYKGKWAKKGSKYYFITGHGVDEIVTLKGVGSFTDICEPSAVLRVDRESFNFEGLENPKTNKVEFEGFHIKSSDTTSKPISIRNRTNLTIKHCYFDLEGKYLEIRVSQRMTFNKCGFHCTPLLAAACIQTEMRYCAFVADNNSDSRMMQLTGTDLYISEAVFDGTRSGGRSACALNLINSKLFETESNVDDYSFYFYNVDTVFTGINYEVKLSNTSLQEFRIDAASVDHLVGISGVESYGNIEVRLPGLTNLPAVSLRADGVEEYFNPTRKLVIDTPFTSYKIFGTTAERPALPAINFQYFDTDVGLPIWYDGSNWINAAGTTV